MGSAFAKAINDLDKAAFQALYGRWDPPEPAQVTGLLAGSGVRWWIAGGRAARAGAPPRQHDDTDIGVRLSDLDRLRAQLSDWHLWEADSGTLRPLLPGAPLTPGCRQLWARRDAQHPWQLDLLLDGSDAEWVFKRDSRVRLPWPRALHEVHGVPHLRPEVALLHKAHLDRPKDRADLAAARLDPDARAWLADTLDRLGQHDWAAATGPAVNRRAITPGGRLPRRPRPRPAGQRGTDPGLRRVRPGPGARLSPAGRLSRARPGPRPG